MFKALFRILRFSNSHDCQKLPLALWERVGVRESQTVSYRLHQIIPHFAGSCHWSREVINWSREVVTCLGKCFTSCGKCATGRDELSLRRGKCATGRDELSLSISILRCTLLIKALFGILRFSNSHDCQKLPLALWERVGVRESQTVSYGPHQIIPHFAES
jgi:hypothetical protein